jgi:glutamate---cysteine ligase / carboxylate-amine ligase
VSTVGVEEELMILDAATYEPAAASHLLVGELDAGTLKTELHASVVELTTPLCRDVAEAVASLRELRRAAADRAAAHGLVVAAAGAHPTAALESLPVVQEERYLAMLREIGWAARRQGVNGLHVHLGMPSPDATWERLESVLGWLPAVLALSCNSPCLDGEETGMLSNRAAILAELPRGGAPPAFDSFADWQAWVDRLVSLGVLADYTRLWWDVRPHPRLGTLEIRICDQPTSLARTELLVQTIAALVESVPSRPTPRGDYLQNRWAAARFGTEAQLIHPDGTRLAGVGEVLGFDPPASEATLRRTAPQLVDETLRF